MENQSGDSRKVGELKRIIVFGMVFLLMITGVYCVKLGHDKQKDKESHEIAAKDEEIIYKEGDSDKVTPLEILEEAEAEIPQEVVNVEKKKRVYLTFDDGPSDYTDRILDILKSYYVKATFFVIGHADMDEKYRRIIEEGHTIGLHSYSHKYKSLYASIEAFDAELNQIRSYVREITGVDTNLFRFPGGSSNKVSKIPIQDCIRYLNDRDYVYFDWNIDAGDAMGTNIPVETLVTSVLNEKLENYDTIVILLHDSNTSGTTVEALPEIIEGLLERGLEILPITDTTPVVQHVKAESVQSDT